MKFPIFKILISSLILIGHIEIGYAQTASILPPAKTTFVDKNGKPLTSGTVESFIPGTTTHKTTWQDAGKATPNANPLTLDGSGRAIILGDGSYRQVLKDRYGNIVWDGYTASTGTGGGGGTATVGDGQPVGSVQVWAGFAAPSQYAFAYGQEFVRTSFPELFAALTSQQNVNCTIGSAILTGIDNTEQLAIGAKIESACLNPGATIISKTISTVTASANSVLSTSSSARFFNYGNGDGSSTFNLPDLRGKTFVGRCNMGSIDCANLTTAYYGSNPNGLGVSGGVQSHTLTQAQLPAVTLPVSTSGTITVTSANQLLQSNVQVSSYTLVNGAGSNLAAFAAGSSQVVGYQSSSGVNSMSGTTGALGSGAAFSRIQPSMTMNYVIKTTPDTNPNSFFGVASIGGMQGIILCGQGVTCAGNTISALTSALAPPTPVALGGIFQSAAPTNQYATGVDAAGNILYASGSTTVNGQVCTIGGSCTISASAGTITVGTTAVTSGTSNGLLFNAGGVLGNTAAVNNGVVITNGSGVPSVGTTNVITNTHLTQGPAATLKGNPTAGSANVQDFAIQGLVNKPSPDANNDRLVIYDASTGTLKNCTVGQCGSVGSSGVTSYNGLTGSVAGFTTDKVIYLSTSGNDSNNGLSPESAKLTLQAAITAASGGGTVFAASGTYGLSTAVNWASGVKLYCSPGTKFQENSGANLVNLVSFASGPADNAVIDGCNFDGNRANNTDNYDNMMLMLGTASDVTIRNSLFENSAGGFIALQDSVRASVLNNKFSNFFTLGVSLIPTTSNFYQYSMVNGNRFIGAMGQHVYYAKWSNSNIVSNNTVIADQTIGVVNTSGTTVTYVSGANFANVTPGSFITINGIEYLVTAKASSTSLTTNNSAGTQSDKAYIAGTGDIISVGNSSSNLIQGNNISGGGAGGIVSHQYYGTQTAYGNFIQGNKLTKCAQACISVASDPVGGLTQIVGTKISDNFIIDGGRGATAIDARVRTGISVLDYGTNLNTYTTIDNNFIIDSAGATSYGIMTTGLYPGYTYAGKNTILNSTNFGIQNALGTITPNGNWGSGPTVTDQFSLGDNFYFKVNPGSSPIANPSVDITLNVSTLSQPRQYKCKSYDNNGGAVNIVGDIQPGTASIMTLTFIGFTPATGVPVLVSCSG